MAVGMASNFGHRSRSRRSSIFGYGRRTSALGPTLIFLPAFLEPSYKWYRLDNQKWQFSFKVTLKRLQ